MLRGDKELIKLAGLMRKVVVDFRKRGFPDLKGSIGYRKEVCCLNLLTPIPVLGVETLLTSLVCSFSRCSGVFMPDYDVVGCDRTCIDTCLLFILEC